MKKKFRENLKKKITLAMATILTIGAIPTLNPIDVFAGQSVTYVQSSLGKTGGNVTFKGDNANAATHNANTAIAVDKDNNNNYGYCISAGLPSVEDGNMVMDIKETLTEKDKNVLGIMNAGFPNNSYGLDQKNAYLATEIAIKHYVLQHPSDYYNAYWATGSREEVKFNNDDWSHWSGDSNIINIAKTIYDTGLANPYNGNSEGGSLTVSATDDGKLDTLTSSDKLSSIITISSTSPYTSGTLTFDDPVIQSMGATVTVDGVATPINNNAVQLPANAKEVVVSVDKSLAEAEHEKKYPGDENASQYFTVNATIKTIGNGGSSLNIGINRLGHNGQNYAVMMQGNDIATQQSIKWNRTTEPGEVPETSKLKIVKVEDGTTKGLAGAIFKVISLTDGVLGTYTSNSSGEINLDVAVGNYTVEEIVPPHGYVLSDNNHQDIYVAEEIESVVTFENKKKTEIEITKIDGVTKKPLANATIRIALDGGSNYVDVVTGADGKAKLDNLTEGTYLVTEVISPEGYLLNETPYSIKLLSGQVGKITIPNYSGGTTTLIKYDEATGLPLENAEFSLSKKDGSIIYEGMTGSDGTITITDLETGWYSWTELAPPTNYFMTIPSKDFYLDAGKHVTVKFDNREKPSLKIRKIDSKTGEALVGATFKIWATEGATVIEKQTDKNGEILLEHLDEGIYSVQEINAPTGYVLNNEIKNIKLEWSNTDNMKEIVFTNSKKPSLIITKHDLADGSLLPNAEFSITTKEGDIVFEGLTDKDGQIKLTDLDTGWYTVTEMQPPVNYTFGDFTSKDVYLSGNENVTVKFDNKLKPSLEITKIDGETSKPLPNTTFRIEKEDGTFKTEITTDKDGKILLKNIEEGVYTVTEIISSSGYVLNNEPKTIHLKWQSDNDFVHTLIFDNYTKPSLIVEKYDEMTNELLPNAQFRIEGVDNNFLWEGVLSKGELTSGATKEISGSLEDGRIVINGLEEGTYRITELNPPNGYTFSDTTINPKTVVVEKNKTTTVKIDNRPLPDLEILKIDSVTKEPLKNATFEIKNLDEDFAIQKQTDENGIIKLTDIAEGNYVVTEKSAPSNYILDSNNKETIKIQWNGGNSKDGQYSLVFENTLKPTLVINKKSGLGGFGLAGARFEIQYRQNDGGLKNLGTFTTNTNGQIVLPYVNDGWYIITEVKAPMGYQLPSNPTKEVYLSAGENSYSDIEVPNTANDGNITVSGGSGVKVTYGSEIQEIASLFSSSDSVVYGSSIDFDNYPLNSIVIKKTDALTGKLLAGATFEVIKVAEGVSGSQGTTIGSYTTDYTGVIVITGLTSGHYIVKESQAPINYDLNVNNQQQAYLAEDGTSIIELMFSNYPYGKLVINKMDADTKQPLANATFEVTNSKGEYVGTAGNGHYTTNIEGTISFDNLPPDSYVITEIKAPTGYAIDQENNVKVVEIGYGETKEVDFYNKAFSTLVIRKLDMDTREPLANAEFKITTSTGEIVGRSNGLFLTDKDGLITITDLPTNTYIVTETKAPTNYILSDVTQNVNLRGNATQTLTFYNTKKSSAQILKIDSETKEPLKDAEFKVYKANGELLNTYKTDGDGLIILPNLENGWYKAIESKAPNGYIIDDTAQDFEIKGNQFVKLVFENKKMTSLIIKKVSDSDGSPLNGATFVVEKQNGELVGEYTTGKDGLITIPQLKPDWYIISETKAPNGYILDETPKTVEVKTNVPTVVTFTNKLKSGLQIIKIDSKTGQPLSGAEFTVYKKSGDVVGNFTTNKDGVIIVDGLENGWYKVAESKAPIGYQIDETPKDVELKGDEFHKIVFANTAMGGLKIIKTNSKTGEPIANVEFEISKMNGEKVLNESNGTKFVTNSTGQIYLPNLADGTYTITETKQAEGYFIDPSPKNVIVTAGKPTILEVPNTPASGLVIIKTDEETGKPLQGVEFDILRADGSRVTADILDKNQPNTENNSPNKTVNGNGAVNGSFTTDSQGRIYLNHLAVGEYHVIETKALDGYELDKTVHSVTVREGKQETLKVTNKQLSSILLRKIDADSKQGLMGARFLLYNEKGVPIGEFRSDNEGYVHIDRKLEDGKYFIEEVEAPAGYVVDSQRKTIYVQQGRTTSIVWENRLLAGQIQITKRSADYNDVTKLPAGSLLENAVFEVYNTKNNVVDVITTDYRGIGASKGLPVGVYFVKEVQAPQYYALNDKEMWVEISHDGDIVKLDVLNKSLYLDVNVRKQGPTTINAGETLTYHITDVRNNSNSALTNFIIHDQIPVGALRVEKIITGTFNERVNYSIKYKTNKNGEYRTLASNLLSKNSYEFSLHPNVLGLAQDEFITDVKMEFPRVSSGFASLTSTQLKMYVLPTTASGYEITNMATAGGYAGTTFEHAVSTWKTVVQKSVPKNPLPKTGY